MGYSDEQIQHLGETIDRVECDVVLIGTPIDLARLIELHKPALRVRYDLKEKGEPTVTTAVGQLMARA
jgi:predicted GTPase